MGWMSQILYSDGWVAEREGYREGRESPQSVIGVSFEELFATISADPVR